MEISAPVMLLPSLEQLFAFLSEEPFARSLQVALLLGASCLVFLVFYVTRDILSRTHSLTAQILCIFLVAALPLLGFLLYLLVRPRRTVKEQEIERVLQEILGLLRERNAVGKIPNLKPQTPNKSQTPIPKSRLVAHVDEPAVPVLSA